jgi:hypothetical protein
MPVKTEKQQSARKSREIEKRSFLSFQEKREEEKEK